MATGERGRERGDSQIIKQMRQSCKTLNLAHSVCVTYYKEVVLLLALNVYEWLVCGCTSRKFLLFSCQKRSVIITIQSFDEGFHTHTHTHTLICL